MSELVVTHLAITERGLELGAARRLDAAERAFVDAHPSLRFAGIEEVRFEMFRHNASAAEVEHDGDPGDEDDGATHPDRAFHLAIVGWRFRCGGVLCFYPARLLPSLPDHDPGDEEPRLALKCDAESL